MKRDISKRIYLSSPTMHGEEMKYIQEAFDTNWVAPLGKNVDEFEREVAAYVGVKHAAALVSGTSAIHLAVKLAGVKPGDVVFCSDLTFAATVNPVSYEGGRQVFIDSERETWNMDPKALDKAFKLYPHPRAVILAHLYGTPAKLDEITAMAVIGANKPRNFVHVIINNAAHESVGGAPTIADHIDFKMIAKGCGYPCIESINDYTALDKALNEAKQRDCMSMIYSVSPRFSTID
ncbi:hypothetical protein AGMMS49992_33650 [Clostridia bacterium]|nr:hypothetical protein AGMMS49992_33650 [Clostridia bacterium]